MTNFVIKEEFWNDTGDYQAYWDDCSGEVTYVTGSPELVERYVAQLNKQFIDAELEKTTETLATEQQHLDRINIQFDAAAGLAFHEREALGIDLNAIVSNKETANRKLVVLNKKIEAINTAPFEGTGWKVPVPRRYVYEAITMVELVDDGGTVAVSRTED